MPTVVRANTHATYAHTAFAHTAITYATIAHTSVPFWLSRWLLGGVYASVSIRSKSLPNLCEGVPGSMWFTG